MDTQSITPSAGLGSKASALLTTLSAQGKSIFTTENAQEILGGSASATYKMLHDLMQGGWLHSLGKGRYLIIPLEAGPERQYTTHSFVIAYHLAPEGYITYWSALHHHGLTEQLPRAVWVATPRRRQEASIAGVEYIFVALRPHKIFGYERVWVMEGSSAPVADLEKSLVDALDHPEHCGGIVEVAKSLDTALTEREPDLGRLTEYARKMRNGAIFKRLGYLAEALSLSAAGFHDVWRAELTAGYTKLDPSRPATGPFTARWRVQANVREAELLGWRGT